MSVAWIASRRIVRFGNICYRHGQVRGIADLRPFAAGDLALLRQKFDRGAPPILTKPLKPGRQINGHKGIINHDDIIGKRVRDVVKTAPLRSGKEGTEYRLHDVKLEEYVRLSRRLVTPIYPADAALIVELLDLHVQPFEIDNESESGTPKLEILEAGTGHGALTLYLSRAIHGANQFPPVFNDNEDEVSQLNAIDDWKCTRNAVIHTIEHSAKYSQHAEKIVKGFRSGLYHGNVDFHVTDVGAWTRKGLSEREGRPFLSHAFLDLPRADEHLKIVAEALRTDGCLMVFTPSITQIVECVNTVKEAGVLLELENVIELGVNGSSGGREWNVRAVKTRIASPHDKLCEEADEREADAIELGDGVGAESEADDSVKRSGTKLTERWSMVCRPKVGERIVGGGFLGVWRKQRDMRNTSPASAPE